MPPRAPLSTDDDDQQQPSAATAPDELLLPEATQSKKGSFAVDRPPPAAAAATRAAELHEMTTEPKKKKGSLCIIEPSPASREPLGREGDEDDDDGDEDNSKDTEDDDDAPTGRGPQNPQDPSSPDDRREEDDDGKGGGAVGNARAAAGREAVASAASERKKEEKRLKKSKPKSSDDDEKEDAVVLLSVLVRWVFLFSLLILSVSRWHGKMAIARETALRLEEERAWADCERMKMHVEACHGDGGANGGLATFGAVVNARGEEVSDNQCPTVAEDRCRPSSSGPPPQQGVTEQIWRYVLEREILLFGFPDPASVHLHIRESLLSALCWSLTFILIRKGLNPDERRASHEAGTSWLWGYYPNLLRYKYWRGAGYGGLGVFHSAFLRGAVKNFFARDAFARLFARLFAIVGAPSLQLLVGEAFVRGPLYDAVMIGLCWGLAQFLVRRRLDPKTNRGDLLKRNWIDVACGSLALTSASLLRTIVKVHSPSLPLPWVWGRFWSCPKILADAARIGLCWGLTFLFMRRGLNPQTNSKGFVARHRNDAMCGSLAMAAFAMLKPAARQLVVTYLENNNDDMGIDGGAAERAMGIETRGMMTCGAPTGVSFASME